MYYLQYGGWLGASYLSTDCCFYLPTQKTLCRGFTMWYCGPNTWLFKTRALFIHRVLHHVVGMCDYEFDNVHVGSESIVLPCLINSMTKIMVIMNYVYRCIGSGRVYIFCDNGHHVRDRIWGAMGDISICTLIIVYCLPVKKTYSYVILTYECLKIRLCSWLTSIRYVSLRTSVC